MCRSNTLNYPWHLAHQLGYLFVKSYQKINDNTGPRKRLYEFDCFVHRHNPLESSLYAEFSSRMLPLISYSTLLQKNRLLGYKSWQMANPQIPY